MVREPAVQIKTLRRGERRQRNVSQPWADRYLEERGIDRPFAEQNGVKVEHDRIVFAKFHPITKERVEGARTRWREPIIIEGEPRKFTQKKKTGNFPYFAPCMPWQSIFNDCSIPFVVSEGELRGLTGAKHNIPVIGCGGVEGPFETGTHRQRLHFIFAEMKLKRRVVYLAFDVDAESNGNVRNAEHTAAKLFADAGADVRIVRIPRVTQDGKTGLDDLLAKPHGREWFGELCEAAPKWSTAASTPDIRPVLVRAEEVEDEPMEFLCPDRILLRVLNGLCGHPSSGKTWIALKIAADGSRGIDTFTGKKIKPFNILYWTNESRPSTIKRRYKAMGGDLSRLAILTGAVDSSDKPVSLTLEDIGVLAQAVKQSKAKLLIVDPLQSVIGAKVDMHRANETRPLLDNLSGLAEREALAVIVIRHLAKAKSTHAVTQALGSIDITAKMRTEYLVGETQDGSRTKALVHVKPGEIQRQESLAFNIDGKNESAKLVWKGRVTLTAQDLLAPEKSSTKPRDAAKDYLYAELSKGPRDPKELEKGGFSPATLNRAAHELRVVMTGSKQAGKRMWELPLAPKWSARRQPEEGHAQTD